MLHLQNITKVYDTGDIKQTALKGVSVSFRENEFVSILGHSGSGKTTMLNIIGGLDRYTDGELVINGVSTREYTDKDWDIYRNQRIGFVFQSYNLIPHQSVLANVELSLTLSGVPKEERRKRAIAVLEKVGLGDHIHKRPNQLSGGQMQRVAIARALVNNPDILLADEPTGALDSETSIQIMELLKEIAKEKLVIMVTHNPDLAEEYSTRIVKIKDGVIISDSDPYEEMPARENNKTLKKISMSFKTALSLSFNNLRTKKGRTILTAFAGSIGIIGIALILSLSTGMNQYITDIQKETMTSYPIVINSQAFDSEQLMGMHAEMIGEMKNEKKDKKDMTKAHADFEPMKTNTAFKSSINKNNLRDFKKYLDDPDSDINQFIGENGVSYGYDTRFSVYEKDPDKKFISSDMELEKNQSPFMDPSLYPTDPNAQMQMAVSGYDVFFGDPSETTGKNFSQMMEGPDGETISSVITDSYDVVYGRWPEKYNEVVLVLDENNSMPAGKLCQLGYITKDRYDKLRDKIKDEKEPDAIDFSYEKLCKKKFHLVPESDHYIEQENGTFREIDNPATEEEHLMKNGFDLKITGIIRPVPDADNAVITTPVAYTAALTDKIIEHTDKSPVVKAQKKDPDINVLTGVRFEPATDKEKIEDVKEYINEMGISEKASLFGMMMYYSGEEGAEAAGSMDESTIAYMLDSWINSDPDDDVMLELYDKCIAESTYDENMEAFGRLSLDTPSNISIYVDDFSSKDEIAACIENYNKKAGKDGKIAYTDYIAMLTSSLTTIVNGISYVLIAFVAISLIVSCIMIGIITHISVMERTKEIGILRALGASKRNISQVFNAETFIIGCCSGVLGILVSLIALIPINSVIRSASGIADLTAVLSLPAALVLIVLGIIITIIGGLLPAKNAAKKDPVVALRTE